MSKKNFRRSLVTAISVISLLCFSFVVSAASSNVYSNREQFSDKKNVGPVWFYELYKPEKKEYVKLDSYKQTWGMWVSNTKGYEWGGVGNGNWLPYWNADAVTTFVAPKDGSITISYDPQKDQAGKSKGNAWLWNGGDGVRIKIMKNTSKVWPTDKEWFELVPIKPNTVPTFKTTLKKGEKLHFHVNAGPDQDISGDNLNWWIRITYSK